eukprot:127768_1
MISDIKNQLDHSQNQTDKLMSNILPKEQYSNVNLLNDFYHIKYDHSTNNDPNQFNAFYVYLFNDDNLSKCDINHCQAVKRCYDRRNINQLTDTTNDRSLHLISRVHTYFIHSYETSRLTPDEIQYIEQQLNEYKEDDENKVNDKKLQLIATITKNKQTTLTKTRFSDYNKFILTDNDSIDCNKIIHILTENSININKQQMEDKFNNYGYHKQA